MKRFFFVLISIICIGIASSMMFSVTAQAADKDTVIALGADLSSEQRQTVLGLMGLTESDLEKCTVIYITNSDEHAYLDAYIDSSIIGTKSLTSVMMTKAPKGSGINVTTKNVNYCTTGMYRNALLTAGVEDRNVLVVAPAPISGTAGVIGAIKAYEVSTGDNVSDNTLDLALDELITTGDIAGELENVDNEDVEALIAWLKSMIATGQLDTSDEKSIQSTIDEGESKFGVSLSGDEEKQIVSLLKRLDSMGLNGSYLISQADNLYKKYGSDVVNQASDVIGEAIDDAVAQASKTFFNSLKESFTGFFSNLFKR